ncbi:hypothetical protein C8F01DRAFT_960856, partial [Mycena amicta]
VKKDNRPFGGIIIILSGDFYQLPPVQQVPLYKSYSSRDKSKSHNAYMARLGRMAWKQIDTVIELTDQKRMEGDPEYAAVVQRLRKHQCTDEDVVLLNSRL